MLCIKFCIVCSQSSLYLHHLTHSSSTLACLYLSLQCFCNVISPVKCSFDEINDKFCCNLIFSCLFVHANVKLIIVYSFLRFISFSEILLIVMYVLLSMVFNRLSFVFVNLFKFVKLLVARSQSFNRLSIIL